MREWARPAHPRRSVGVAMAARNRSGAGTSRLPGQSAYNVSLAAAFEPRKAPTMRGRTPPIWAAECAP